MNGDQMVSQLARSNPQEREDILENLHCALLLNGGRVPFKNTEQSMRQLSQLLAENRSDANSAIVCLQFIADLMPLLGSELDRCMDVCMESLMSCLACEGKAKIQDGAVEVLQKYSYHSESLDRVTRSIVTHGIKDKDVKIRRAAVRNVPDIYIKKVGSGKLGDIITALIRCLSEDQIKADALRSLNRLKDLCGNGIFDSYIRNLPESLKKQYESNCKSETTGHSHSGTKNDSDLLDLFFKTNAPKKNAPVNSITKLDYGLIPNHITAGLNEKSDGRKRVTSIDEVRGIIEDCKRLDDLKPHLKEFIQLLDELLNDKNFKVVSSTLDVLYILVDRLGRGIKSECGLITSVLTKRMSDRNRTTRQSIMKIFVRLSQTATPRILFSTLPLNHSDPIVRQECLNVMIVVMLSCSQADIDIPFTCSSIARSLIDSKRPVRQAAIECTAVLAKLLGSRKSDLLKAITEVERGGSMADRGLTAAVESRIAPGKPLPTLDIAGLVEYSISASRSSATSPDVEWVLGGSGDRRGSVDLTWLEPYAPSVNNAPAARGKNPSVVTRKSCMGLPWEASGDTLRSQYSGNTGTSSGIVQDLWSHAPSNSGIETIKSIDKNFTRKNVTSSKKSAHRVESDNYLDFLFKSDPSETKSEVGMGQRKTNGRLHMKEENPTPPIPTLRDSLMNGDDLYNTPLLSQRSVDETAAVMGRSCGSAGNKKRVNRMFGRLEEKNKIEYFKSEGDLPSLALQSAGGDSLAANQQQKFQQKINYPSPNGKNSSPIKHDEGSPMLGKAQLARKGSMRGAGRGSSSAGTVRSDTREVKSAGVGGGGWGPVKFTLGIMEDDDNVHKSSSAPPNSQIPLSPDDRPIKPMSDMSAYEPVNGVNSQHSTKTRTLPVQRTKPPQQVRREMTKYRSDPIQYNGHSENANSNNHNNVYGMEADPAYTHDSPVRMRQMTKSKSSTLSISQPIESQNQGKVKDSTEDVDPSDLTPCKNPSAVLNEALQQLNDEEWELKVRGLNNVMRLSMHHPDTLLPQLHTVTVAIIAEVKNLRSVVAIRAMKCLACMYNTLKKNMETDLDHTTGVLLQKTADTNNFIKDEASISLNSMVSSINPQKAMASLITTGAGHKNGFVKTAASGLMAELVESQGSERVYNTMRDIMERLVKSSTQFLNDGSVNIRYNGQRIMYVLMQHGDFDRTVSRHLSPEMLRNIQDKLDRLKNKGLPDPPADVSGSNRQRGSTAFPERRASLRYNSAPSSVYGRVTSGSSGAGTINNKPNSNSADVATGHMSNARRRRSQKIDDSTQDEITKMMDGMKANDFRERQMAVDQLKDLSFRSTSAVGAYITKIFDALVPCLRDSNSKVNLSALQALADVIPVLSKHLPPVLNLTVPVLVTNLASANRDIHTAASNCLDLLMQNIDSSVLYPTFTNQAQASNSRCKAEMVNRISELVLVGGGQKSKQLSMHVLPLAWQLIGQSNGASRATSAGPGNINAATSNLVKALYRQMGEGLYEAAAANSTMTPAHQKVLKDFVSGV